MISKNQQKTIRSLASRKNREREGLFVAEGPKVVGDLLKSGFRPRQLYAVEQWNEAEHTIITAEELTKVSFLQHPQQVIGLFELPARDIVPMPDGLCLALDGIQDPGNLGTIIRIADWFGLRYIYCSEDTADAFSPKVVQATMGSIAHIHICYTDLNALLDRLPANFPVYGTLLDGDNIYTHPLTAEGIIVMGNEGNGISDSIRSRVTHRLLIPNYKQGNDAAESLNVAIATAVTCAEFRRRLMP